MSFPVLPAFFLSQVSWVEKLSPLYSTSTSAPSSGPPPPDIVSPRSTTEAEGPPQRTTPRPGAHAGDTSKQGGARELSAAAPAGPSSLPAVPVPASATTGLGGFERPRDQGVLRSDDPALHVGVLHVEPFLQPFPLLAHPWK